MTPKLSRPLAALGLLGSAWLLLARPARADNPIVQHVYTADPAPLVHGDTVYLYTSHDEDVTVDNFFTMNDWRVFSSQDMVNWTDHGSPLGYRSFSWATGKAWAPHAVERDGKFYLYVPVSNSIGVAVSDSPTGPFVDALGKPLLSNYQYIDPTVHVDAEGRAYLYFGNPKLWYVELNRDMISYSGPVREVPMTAASFGSRSGDAARPTSYEEGPWFYARSDLYYLVFASGPLPEKISYATSPAPTGPWAYRGVIMNNQAGHAFTNHSGVVDFKGRSYFFYHTQELSGGGGYKRSVAVEEFSYGADGAFPTIEKTKAGVTKSVAPLNPFQRVEAETIAWAPSVEVGDCSEGGRAVTKIDDGDFIKVASVDLRTGATSFRARVASGGAGGSVELRLDTATGTLLGACAVAPTGGPQQWATVECDVDSATGIHDLFLSFKGGGSSLFDFNYWQLTPKDASGGGGAGGAASGGASGTASGEGGATGGTMSGGGGGGGSSNGNAGETGSSGGLAGTGGGLTSGGSPASGGSPTPPRGDETLGTESSGCTCATPRGASARSPWAMRIWAPLIVLASLRRKKRARRCEKLA